MAAQTGATRPAIDTEACRTAIEGLETLFKSMERGLLNGQNRFSFEQWNAELQTHLGTIRSTLNLKE